MLEYEEKFDKVRLNSLLVSEEEIAEAEKKVSIELKAAITLAYNNIRTFHTAQVFQGKKITTLPGVTCWQKAVAIEKVGLYIPGGTGSSFLHRPDAGYSGTDCRMQGNHSLYSS